MSALPHRGLAPARRNLWRIPIVMILLISSACNMPTVSPPTQKTATPPPVQPTTAKVPNQPPVLVETDPPAGSQVPLRGPLTFIFDQPMDRASVEGALRGQPTLSGHFTWKDNTTVSFTPDQPFAPSISLEITLNTSARSAAGLAVNAATTLSFTTAPALKLTQSLPAPGSTDIDPTSAIVAAFNQPVVPLGADMAAQPAAFTIQPAAQGHGEWLNTSTYIFYPKPGLPGGKAISVSLNKDLGSTAGASLAGKESTSWSFTTALPRLVSVQPSVEKSARLDAPVVLTFNQPMDPPSVEAGFSLSGSNGAQVTGSFDWDAQYTTLTFKPGQLLARGASYAIHLSSKAKASGGTPLGADFASSFSTVPDFAVISTQPSQGQFLNVGALYGPVVLRLSGPFPGQNVDQFVKVDPPVSNLIVYPDPETNTLNVSGFFSPDSSYTLTLSPDFTDAWGQKLDQPFELRFRTSPAQPSLLVGASMSGSGVTYLTPRDTALPARVTNLKTVTMQVAPIGLPDFQRFIGTGGYNALQNFNPAGLETHQQSISVGKNQNQDVALRLTRDGKSLEPGLYYINVSSPDLPSSAKSALSPILAVVSSVQVTFKISQRDVLVWAVKLADDSPVSGSVVKIYDDEGSLIAQGSTDDQGLFHSDIPLQSDPYHMYFALLEQPGQANFAMALSSWNQGINAWDFNLLPGPSGSGVKVYMYTDRPIYRPGQTVYFRAILRQADNGRYAPLDRSQVTVKLFGSSQPDGTLPTLGSLDLQLSAFGSVHGEFTLPADAQPGSYQISLPGVDNSMLFFQVAEYRKPQIDLQVQLSSTEILQGDQLQATVKANYFFGAPAGNLAVHWSFTSIPAPFYLPNASVGLIDTSWMNPAANLISMSMASRSLGEGDTRTGPDGALTLNLSVPKDLGDTQTLTLEVTASDETGQPVSARATSLAHPSSFYIGLHPDSWTGQAGTQIGFDVLSVDWAGKASPTHALHADFKQVEWKTSDTPPVYPGMAPSYVPEYTLAGSTDFLTDTQGKARIAFTPAQAGTYLLDVSGGGAHSQALVWVGGAGQAIWPSLPDQRIQLTSDATSYTPGQTARIFVPNPFTVDADALVTVERGRVMYAQVLKIPAGGESLPVKLEDLYAPNVYVAVTLLGQNADGFPDFRQGFVELKVSPQAEELNVKISATPLKTVPGNKVTLTAQVSDADGQPVEGEFSLALVDRAVLALADPNAPDILSAFYGQQPLNVQTALDLAAYAGRIVQAPPGMGGGGGEGPVPPVTLREKFPDTAFWQGDLTTNADGQAQVTVTLPDNVTTWQALLRGLTADTRVGEATVDITASKDLLVQPETPLFLVAGDHTELTALVHNNTTQDLQVEASLQVSGFILDNGVAAAQKADVPANGRALVSWWGTAQSVDKVSPIFSVSATTPGGTLQDAARPDNGDLPVLRYSVPQTFSTAGVLAQSGQDLELIALPHSYTPTGGQLDLELSPSLASAILASLDAFVQQPVSAFNEADLSSFLPRLEAYRALTSLGVDAPTLKAGLDQRVTAGIRSLISAQNQDGGWGWMQGSQSDPYISAYVVFGLSRAKEAGFEIKTDALQHALTYLQSTLVSPQMTTQPWELDRLALQNFALQQAGAGNPGSAAGLYGVRDQLDPWAKALLALTLDGLEKGSQDAQTLVSDLEATAIRSATGAHWQDTNASGPNLSTPLFSSAAAVYALARLDPASTLLPDAVRYLAANRSANSMWSSGYETSWVILALAETLKGTGELQSSYNYGATLNGSPLASGQAGGPNALTAVHSSVALSDLHQDGTNSLVISREEGTGRLYYRASLSLERPAETVAPLDAGLSVSRAYYPASQDCRQTTCTPVQSVSIGSDSQASLLTVRVTLNVPNDAYYVQIADYIPAGAEILDKSLKTSQQNPPEATSGEPVYDPRDPYAAGWGWWYFSAPQVYDDHIAWTAAYLPAGTYQLTYTLVPLQSGEFRLLPAHAWETYFPEVQGASAGAIFKITP